MAWRLFPQAPAAHGGRGGGIDLSASLNPLGPSKLALEAARAANLERYPQVDAADLRQAAARRHHISQQAIVPIPGASFGLWLLITVLTRPGDVCLALAPCFGEYRRSAEIAGAHYWEVRATEPEFDWSLHHVSEKLSRGGATLCILANPANPSGRALPAGKLRDLCRKNPATIFVVDEAFAAFGPPGLSLLDGKLPPNAIVVRSLTKELGLPGLRMGYLVADSAITERLAGVMPPWPISSPSLAAAVAGLADVGHITEGARRARAHLRDLTDAFCASGFSPVASSANYMLVRAPGATAELAARGVTVRDCASFGLPDFVRVAAPTAADLPAVIDAIRSLGAARR